jgi:anti-sigma factor RsiW
MKIFSRLKRHPSLCCRDVNEFLALYVEGGLDDEVRDRFETHLSRCPQCSGFLAQYRTTVDMVHEAEDAPPPPDVLVEATLSFLRRHFDDESDAPRPRSSGGS